MFKPGQRVAYKDDGTPTPKWAVEPKDGEVLTIKAHRGGSYWSVEEYFNTAPDGGPQYFHQRLLKPIVEDSNYAEETLKDIRILQLEQENKELRELTQMEPLTND